MIARMAAKLKLDIALFLEFKPWTESNLNRGLGDFPGPIRPIAAFVFKF